VVPEPVTNSPSVASNPLATQEVVDGQATDWRPASELALSGGASVAVHVVPEPVTSIPSL
jgi:hypothetical protein